MADLPKLTVEQYNTISNGGWAETVEWDVVKTEFKKHQEAWKKAWDAYNKKDRPLRILAVHGSGRAYSNDCNYTSNSQYLLKEALKVVPELDKEIEIDEVVLNEYNINACYNCVAITSALCGAPCSCHPVDGMQQLYPKFLRADVHLFSTGVNQSMPSSRLKLMFDRMISLDGGVAHGRPEDKMSDEFIAKMMALSANGDVAYDQRLYGRVAGYFIASKDENNPHKTANHEPSDDEGIGQYGYMKAVGFMLKDNLEAYGYFHDPMYYAGAAADPDIDYMYDRETLKSNTKAIEDGKEVIRKAIALAKKLKTDLPEYKSDRINRT